MLLLVSGNATSQELSGIVAVLSNLHTLVLWANEQSQIKLAVCAAIRADRRYRGPCNVFVADTYRLAIVLSWVRKWVLLRKERMAPISCKRHQIGRLDLAPLNC